MRGPYLVNRFRISEANLSGQIAELVSEYRRFEDSQRLAVTPSRRDIKRSRSTDNLVEPLAATPGVEDCEDVGEEEGSDEETDASSVSIPMMCQSLSVAQKRAVKRKMKAEKSIRKASKNQRKHITHIVTVRRGDIDTVGQAIHGDDYGAPKPLGHPLATDKTIEEVIERNLGFVSAQQSHRSFLLKTLARQRDSATAKNRRRSNSESETTDTNTPEKEEGIDDVVEAVLARLGIQSASAASSSTLPAPKPPPVTSSSFGTPGSCKRTKTAILQKLSAAIAEDIEHHESELKQTHQRAAGFWRYANQEILVRLTTLASEVDWATGEKLNGKDRRDGC